eukprot:TRINITY_DN10996_c0_g1_i1.p1 TRINITY_DN10996_c0_g1~~TRINITY_DN10996_c0_g1_i1.p1  ORF type:complete len:366 (+),score=38.38 TRINITY_DN10996_c0_g1_i1:149-1099(+)
MRFFAFVIALLGVVPLIFTRPLQSMAARETTVTESNLVNFPTSHQTSSRAARPQHEVPEDARAASPAKLIVVSGPTFQPILRYRDTTLENCPVPCNISMREEDVARADAITFNLIGCGGDCLRGMPKEKPSKQLWLFNQFFEAPINVGMRPNLPEILRFDQYIDYTFTFLSKSDFVAPFYKMLPLTPQDESAPPETNIAANKTGLLVWVVSNCEGGRKQFFENLAKLLPENRTRLYGGCGHKLPCGDRRSEEGRACFRELLGSYKFVAALENNRCQGYITEKPVNAFTTGSVPVVVGGTSKDDYEAIYPKGSFIYC